MYLSLFLINAIMQPGHATRVKSCILQQCDLFENNVSQNDHLFVFAYSHQSGKPYRSLYAYQQFELCTDRNHNKPLFKNLLKRLFDVDASDLAYIADITYIWTREGWLYLAVVIDLYSRNGVG
jgi:hypothetical protein